MSLCVLALAWACSIVISLFGHKLISSTCSLHTVCDLDDLYLAFKGLLLRPAQCDVCVFVCVCVSVSVRLVTPSISFALEKVTLVESSLHLGLPCPWILWVFMLEEMAEWDDIHYICLTADRLVLTHPPHMLVALCYELPGYILVEQKNKVLCIMASTTSFMIQVDDWDVILCWRSKG